MSRKLKANIFVNFYNATMACMQDQEEFSLAST